MSDEFNISYLHITKDLKMRIMLFLLTILSFIFGAVIFTGAKSAIHEIEAFVLFLISAVFFSGAGIVEAVNQLRKQISNE